MSESIPAEVLASWSGLAGQPYRPIGSGLINATYLVEPAKGPPVILQRLHPVFRPEVNEDIDAVTARLAAAGMVTPRVIPRRDGTLWTQHGGATWRALTYVPGHTRDSLASPEQAREAGRLVARFHRALAGFDHLYRFRRGNVHDTPAHLARLEQALGNHASHRLFDRAAPMGDELLAAAGRLTDLSALPQRHAHGDLKISNLMFDEAGRGVCLIDLDTVALMAWPLEMGDAMRSWCNPRREDQRPARLDTRLLAAALSGYAAAAGDFPTAAERAALIDGLLQICLELSARFLADTLDESYFGWDTSRYPSRGEHNLVRAQATWELYRDVRAQEAQAREIARASLAGG